MKIEIGYFTQSAYGLKIWFEKDGRDFYANIPTEVIELWFNQSGYNYYADHYIEAGREKSDEGYIPFDFFFEEYMDSDHYPDLIKYVILKKPELIEQY